MEKKKLNCTTEELCKDLPKCFTKFHQYLSKLKYKDKPDYKMIIKMFEQFLQAKKIQPVFYQYDWFKPDILSQLYDRNAEAKEYFKDY